jgi:hypothetical protein
VPVELGQGEYIKELNSRLQGLLQKIRGRLLGKFPNNQLKEWQGITSRKRIGEGDWNLLLFIKSLK